MACADCKKYAVAQTKASIISSQASALSTDNALDSGQQNAMAGLANVASQIATQLGQKWSECAENA